jgi:hypothetical protein
MNKICLASFLLIVLALTGCASAPQNVKPCPQPMKDDAAAEGTDPAVPAVVRYCTMREVKPLTADIANKKIFIEVEKSPKATMIVRQALQSHGYTVVESQNEAEAKFTVIGTFSVSRLMEKPKNGKLGDLLEASIDEASLNEAKLQDHFGEAVVSSAVRSIVNTDFTKFWSITSMAEWVSTVTGVRGWFNKMVAGDPRGFCMNKDCDKFFSSVFVAVSGENAFWTVGSTVKTTKVALDQAVSEAMENALTPFYDLKPLPQQLPDAVSEKTESQAHSD